MKVTVDFGSEIDSVVQRHLDGHESVQVQIRAAVMYFQFMLMQEETGKMSTGFGDKSRFSTYNTVVSPKAMLNEIRGEMR